MNKKKLIQSFCVALMIAFLPMAAESAEKKPNVLFLFADDMRADTIAALGDKVAKTPNIDSLVNRGISFTNAYCMGGNSGAVCTPSRNMMLSGNAYFRWKDFKEGNRPKGMISPGDGPNFPLSMKAAGYETYHHGKRGNTAPLIQARFDHNKYLKNDDVERKSGEPGKEIADEAIAFLRDRNSDNPFFMYLAFGNPHDPRVAAQKYLDQIDSSKIQLPANFLPEHPFDNGELKVRDEMLAPHPRPVDIMKKQWHEYYATQLGMDYHIGRILEQLKSSGLFENTIIVFSADQGIALGSHGLLGKQNLYDHSMKSPLILAGPGIRNGNSDALVHLFDIYPTVVDLVGEKPSEKIDGRSFKAVIDGKSTKHREMLMLAYRDVQRAIVTPHDKLIYYPKARKTQLFNRKTDPYEMKNLFDDPDEFDKWKELFRQLEIMQDQYGDDLELNPPGN
jgi:arylsulfatase A-like enzyme